MQRHNAVFRWMITCLFLLDSLLLLRTLPPSSGWLERFSQAPLAAQARLTPLQVAAVRALLQRHR